MTSDLIIHTSKRSYHLLLKLRTKYMRAVAWYYTGDVEKAETARQLAQREAAAQTAENHQ
jgi:type IV secretory pathway VirB9-like protein